MTIEHRLESILQNLKRDELNIVARKLKVKAYRKYNQKKIISIILTEADQKNLRKLLKITWWDKWHNHFYGFATILALLLAVLFYMFPRESPTETNSAEIQKETLDIVKRMKQRRKTDHEELIKKYPEGYYLFAADGYKTIPDQQVRSRFSLDPDNSKILLVNNSIIHLLLKSFVYKPNDIEFEFLNILLDNQKELWLMACHLRTLDCILSLSK